MKTSTLNFDYANASKLLLPSAEQITLALVGCGGTGSWLAPAVCRVARLLGEKFNKQVKALFFDPDIVEPKNVYRQNFCEAEIGRNKAEALAFRYSAAWGLEITAVAAEFDQGQLRELTGRGYGDRLEILIGCVDGPAGRRAMLQAAQESSRACWWLDCGNHQAAGQVLVGNGRERPADPFQLQGFCSWLPLPSKVHPELAEDLGGQKIESHDGLSCADMAMADSQGLAINQMMAAIAADYLTRMLLTKDLTRMATYVDLASGSIRSVYITPENVCTQTNEGG